MSPPELVIRSASAADAAAMAALLDELGYTSPQDRIAARMERMAAEGQHVLLAELDARSVGLASVFVRSVIVHDKPFARLAALVVARDARGQGIGAALVTEVERLARRAGCSLLEVTSGPHRPVAHEFYKRLGFTEKPRRFVKELR